MVKREEINGFSVHELIIHVGRNGPKLRLYEAIDSQKATRFFEENGHKDPFGCKAWPSAYLVAERLLGENLKGSSVLELGCGTGLVSIAAKLGGASQVLATDQARLNLDLAQRSAALNEVDLDVEVFDVTSEAPLPRYGSMAFDYVVFSDVLYWPAEAIAFAKRAAEAFGAGSTVIMADPGRRREDFLGTLRVELEQRVVDPASVPRVAPEPTTFPEHVFDWVSSEVKTASSLFCQEPFILTLRPKTSFCADGPPWKMWVKLHPEENCSQRPPHHGVVLDEDRLGAEAAYTQPSEESKKLASKFKLPENSKMKEKFEKKMPKELTILKYRAEKEAARREDIDPELLKEGPAMKDLFGKNE
eukprot:symbB.v1.2.023872.t1/scaffold2219.1/size85424/2